MRFLPEHPLIPVLTKIFACQGFQSGHHRPGILLQEAQGLYQRRDHISVAAFDQPGHHGVSLQRTDPENIARQFLNFGVVQLCRGFGRCAGLGYGRLGDAERSAQ